MHDFASLVETTLAHRRGVGVLVLTLGVMSPLSCSNTAGDQNDDGAGGNAGSHSEGGEGGIGGSGGAAELGGQGGNAGEGGISTERLGLCSNPREHLGYVECDEGYRHRVDRVACENVERTERIAGDFCNIEADCCAFDSDCPDGSACWFNGTVQTEGEHHGDTFGTCSPRCTTDDDCNAGFICECGDGAGRCVQSSCTTDADCDEGAFCVSSDVDNTCPGYPTKYSCQSASDECAVPADCDVSGPDNETCATDGARRVCMSQVPQCDS